MLGGRGAAFPEELEIRFSGSRVQRVTATIIVLWNAGKTTILGAEVVASDPLRIELQGEGKILKLSHNKVKRKVNDIKTVPSGDSGKSVEVKFDFLDPGDGITIEILHSGALRALRLVGTLRGLPSGITHYGRASWYQGTRAYRIFPPRFALEVIAILGIILVIYGLLRPQLHLLFPGLDKVMHQDPMKLQWSMVTLGTLYAVLPIAVLWKRRRRYPADLYPSSGHDTETTNA